MSEKIGNIIAYLCYLVLAYGIGCLCSWELSCLQWNIFSWIVFVLLSALLMYQAYYFSDSSKLKRYIKEHGGVAETFPSVVAQMRSQMKVESDTPKYFSCKIANENFAGLLSIKLASPGTFELTMICFHKVYGPLLKKKTFESFALRGFSFDENEMMNTICAFIIASNDKNEYSPAFFGKPECQKLYYLNRPQM